ncbi:MAG: hypothetical protein GHCLOJNM_03775 [bacterium]|nr:hypothetical protein [bacterium]
MNLTGKFGRVGGPGGRAKIKRGGPSDPPLREQCSEVRQCLLGHRRARRSAAAGATGVAAAEAAENARNDTTGAIEDAANQTASATHNGADNAARGAKNPAQVDATGAASRGGGATNTNATPRTTRRTTADARSAIGAAIRQASAVSALARLRLDRSIGHFHLIRRNRAARSIAAAVPKQERVTRGRNDTQSKNHNKTHNYPFHAHQILLLNFQARCAGPSLRFSEHAGTIPSLRRDYNPPLQSTLARHHSTEGRGNYPIDRLGISSIFPTILSRLSLTVLSLGFFKG